MSRYQSLLAEKQFRQAVREDLEAKRARMGKLSEPATLEATQSGVQSILDQPLEFIESPSSLKAARLPLWPTKVHLDALVQSGKLDVANIFVGEGAWNSAEINPEVPQVFGYTIQDESELAMVITDKEALENAKKEFETSGTYPTVYAMNHQARLAHAAYLGGRLPEHAEQKAFWNKLPWANVLEKATGAGIPFTGCFDADDRRFLDVGEWACLMSSSPCEGGHESLSLGRVDHKAVGHWSSAEHGCSSLVVFG